MDCFIAILNQENCRGVSFYQNKLALFSHIFCRLVVFVELVHFLSETLTSQGVQMKLKVSRASLNSVVLFHPCIRRVELV